MEDLKDNKQGIMKDTILVLKKGITVRKKN